MKASIVASRIAARIKQVLLAANIDIEQRWVILDKDDRLDAIIDDLVLDYAGVYADESVTDDDLAWLVDKVLSDLATADDEFARSVAFVRDFTDEGVPADAIHSLVDKLLSDPVGPDDITAIDFTQSLREDQAAVSDLLGLTTEHFCSDAVASSDSAWRNLGPVISDLATAPDSLGIVASFVRTFADTPIPTDTPAKSMLMPFSDVGYLYVWGGTIPEDYVEAGTGPVAYDSFSYSIS